MALMTSIGKSIVTTIGSDDTSIPTSKAVKDATLAGTGAGSSAGKVYIGKADGTFTLANLTEGSNITITNADGSITIAASGTGGGLDEPNVIARAIIFGGQ